MCEQTNYLISFSWRFQDIDRRGSILNFTGEAHSLDTRSMTYSPPPPRPNQSPQSKSLILGAPKNDCQAGVSTCLASFSANAHGGCSRQVCIASPSHESDGVSPDTHWLSLSGKGSQVMPTLFSLRFCQNNGGTQVGVGGLSAWLPELLGKRRSILYRECLCPTGL